MINVNLKDSKNEIEDFVEDAKKLKEKDYESFQKIFYLVKGACLRTQNITIPKT